MINLITVHYICVAKNTCITFKWLDCEILSLIFKNISALQSMRQNQIEAIDFQNINGIKRKDVVNNNMMKHKYLFDIHLFLLRILNWIIFKNGKEPKERIDGYNAFLLSSNPYRYTYALLTLIYRLYTYFFQIIGTITAYITIFSNFSKSDSSVVCPKNPLHFGRV